MRNIFVFFMLLGTIIMTDWNATKDYTVIKGTTTIIYKSPTKEQLEQKAESEKQAVMSKAIYDKKMDWNINQGRIYAP